MLTITVTKDDLTYNIYRNVVMFQIKEISYVEYELAIVYSFFPSNYDTVTISMDELNNIDILQE